jgi:hypothetical protein
MSTETYNPQERTFIKTPERKTCITCGQPLAPDVKPLSNHMNHYLNTISGTTVVINSNENTIVVQGVTLYRVDGQDFTTGQRTSSYVPATPNPKVIVTTTPAGNPPPTVPPPTVIKG